ncbi:recombinase RecT [Listeria monocytogenes]|uniref:recombinase RecT n=1 Tax=Listeria monocytogenes TaxID=1639 RepID=UPI00083D25EA|nr:recombinase RecT [Listeria monocytogenes]EAF1263056.1 recombinase RecT [Listeria monocytogenes]EAF1311645.1 recombinase RecT [Listeria monocytogenes]EJB4842043.1 recombinase RecT [Listeria monocytogenes]ODE69241.1 recombinase RecT [Listeria monocytogenes]
MATNNSLKKDVATKQSGDVGTAQSLGLKGMLNAPTMKKKFEEVQGKKAPQFMTSLLNIYNGDTNLQKVDPMSVITSAMVAATLDLPIDKNLGYAWLVPYSGKAQFQLGYKGYIQLALRTGQYKAINVIEVREGELIKWNRLTEELELDLDATESDEVIGYCGYFRLINGFEKTVYWTQAEVQAHKKKFSKSGMVWNSDWDAMAKKTVLRNLLSKWGILSIDMQTAVTSDEADPQELKEVTDISEQEIIEAQAEPEVQNKPSDTLPEGSEVQGSIV